MVPRASEERGDGQRYPRSTAHPIEIRTDEGVARRGEPTKTRMLLRGTSRSARASPGRGECFGPGNAAPVNKAIGERVIAAMAFGEAPFASVEDAVSNAPSPVSGAAESR